MLINDTHLNMINSPVRSFQGKVECYDSTDALAATYTHLDDLQSFQVERVGEGKFFGYGYVQKINIKLLDSKREKEFTTSHKFRVSIGVNDNYVSTFPMFKVTETNRDEKTNALSITAYDALKAAAEHKYGDVAIEDYFTESRITLEDLATACAAHIGIQAVSFIVPEGHVLAQTVYSEDLLNLNGEETLRHIFDWIAEVTMSIYYLDATGTLVFRVLDRDGEAGFMISKNHYTELKSKSNRRLAKITKATTLGDNVHVALAVTGTNQIVMDNPFYELRLDTHTLLEAGAEHMLGLTVNQFECDWRGNYLLEIGDKLALECKDGTYAYSYLLEDKFLFNGAIEQQTEWKWDETQNENEGNSAPTTIGEALNQTTAKVDKVEKEIILIVKDMEEYPHRMSEIEQTSTAIKQTVSEVDAQLDAVNETIIELEMKASQSVSAEEVQIQIEKTIKDLEDIGITEITTKTGFTFNAEGLHIEKSGAEMGTFVSEDGMTITRSNEEVLRVSNEGVKAEDLHATTYLIIGLNSRFEDFDNNRRTGCFWVGEGGEILDG
jgi:hypothetical protein